MYLAKVLSVYHTSFGASCQDWEHLQYSEPFVENVTSYYLLFHPPQILYIAANISDSNNMVVFLSSLVKQSHFFLKD